MKLVSPAGVTSYQVTGGLRVRGSHEMPVSPPASEVGAEMQGSVHGSCCSQCWCARTCPGPETEFVSPASSCFRRKRIKLPSCHAEHCRLHPAQLLQPVCCILAAAVTSSL